MCLKLALQKKKEKENPITVKSLSVTLTTWEDEILMLHSFTTSLKTHVQATTSNEESMKMCINVCFGLPRSKLSSSRVATLVFKFLSGLYIQAIELGVKVAAVLGFGKDVLLVMSFLIHRRANCLIDHKENINNYELYDIKSSIYLNRAVKEKPGMRIARFAPL